VSAGLREGTVVDAYLAGGTATFVHLKHWLIWQPIRQWSRSILMMRPIWSTRQT